MRCKSEAFPSAVSEVSRGLAKLLLKFVCQQQVDELLSEARFDYDDPAVQSAIEKLTSVLTSIPDQQVSADAASGYLSSFGIPGSVSFHRFPKRTHCTKTAKQLPLERKQAQKLNAFPTSRFQQVCFKRVQYLHTRIVLSSIMTCMPDPA